MSYLEAVHANVINAAKRVYKLWGEPARGRYDEPNVKKLGRALEALAIHDKHRRALLRQPMKFNIRKKGCWWYRGFYHDGYHPSPRQPAWARSRYPNGELLEAEVDRLLKLPEFEGAEKCVVLRVL